MGLFKERPYILFHETRPLAITRQRWIGLRIAERYDSLTLGVTTGPNSARTNSAKSVPDDFGSTL